MTHRSLFQTHRCSLVHSYGTSFWRECITCDRLSASHVRVNAFSCHCLTQTPILELNGESLMSMKLGHTQVQLKWDVAKTNQTQKQMQP